MIANKKVEKLENSAVKLSITVSKEETKKIYDELIKGYAKNAQIKGFRKGKVPASVLELKFGDSIKSEATQKIIEESLQEAFTSVEEKPLPYAYPSLADDTEPVLDFDKDFSFAVKYDVYPAVELGEYKGIAVEEPQVTIGKAAEEKELTALQEQNAIVIDKKDGVVEKDSIVKINYAELDADGNEVEGSKREDFTFTVGTGYNLYKLDDDITGMKKDETKVIEKTFADDFEDKNLAGTSKKLTVTVTSVKVRELPELDDDFAQDVSEDYKTLADLKKDIKKKLKENADRKKEDLVINDLIEKVVETSKFDIPQAMIDAELKSQWQQFTQQFQGQDGLVMQLLAAQGKTQADLFEEWKPRAEKSVSGRIVTEEIIKKENIEVEDKDVDAFVGEQAAEAKMTAEELKEYYTKNGLLEYVKQDIKSKKVWALLKEGAEITPGKKVKYVDFMAGNQ